MLLVEKERDLETHPLSFKSPLPVSPSSFRPLGFLSICGGFTDAIIEVSAVCERVDFLSPLHATVVGIVFPFFSFPQGRTDSFFTVEEREEKIDLQIERLSSPLEFFFW